MSAAARIFASVEVTLMNANRRPGTMIRRLLALPGRVAAARRELALLSRVDDRGLSDIGLTRGDLGGSSSALGLRGREREALALRTGRRRPRSH